MSEIQVYTSGCDSNQDMSTHYRATESLGAFDIIDRSNRCVSALAVTKTRVTVLSHHMFAQFCSEHPVVLCHYITDVIARFWRLASFTLHTFLELKEHHPKPADVIQVAECVKECLHSAALTRKVFKCGSVVNMGLDEHADSAYPVLSSPVFNLYTYYYIFHTKSDTRTALIVVPSARFCKSRLCCYSTKLQRGGTQRRRPVCSARC
jgi:hypothetical protein